MDLAARLLQWRHKLKRLRRELKSSKADMPRERWIRKNLMLNITSDDLNKKWRAMHDAKHPSAIPPDVRLSHIKFLLALCTPSNTKYASENRCEIVKKNGLLPICLCLKEVGENYTDDAHSVKTASTENVSLGALGISDMGLTMAHQVSCKLMLQIAEER